MSYSSARRFSHCTDVWKVVESCNSLAVAASIAVNLRLLREQETQASARLSKLSAKSLTD